MSNTIETKLAPQIDSTGQKRWYTPSEARAYYKKYSRDGITIHWWGDGTGASNHDNIVNFFLGRKDQGSVNYVLSDNKITMMVVPDMVAFTSQSGNPTTISIEHQPTLGDSGYKKSGWLVHQLELQYGKTLQLYPHKHWFPTACPGTIDLNRIRAEANKLKGDSMSPTRKPIAPDMVRQHLDNFSNGAVKVKSTDAVCQNRFEDTQSDEFWYGFMFQMKDIIVARDKEIAALKAEALATYIPVSQIYIKKG